MRLRRVRLPDLQLEEIPIEELLRRTLDLILWIPWLSIEQKGAIFLVEDAPDALVMKVHRGLSSSLLSTCARVPFGSCLCGHAAASRSPVYAGNLDERHTTRYSGIAAGVIRRLSGRAPIARAHPAVTRGGD